MNGKQKFVIGYDEYQLKKGNEAPFVWDLAELANGHIGINSVFRWFWPAKVQLISVLISSTQLVRY